MKQLNTLTSHKIWAIIPAAGTGRRFSETELKQYQIINHQTVLEHTVERLNQIDLEGYVIALGEQDDVAPQLNFAQRHKAHFCLGGSERVDSVLSALNYLSNVADAQDWVFVHDAARPCVSMDSLCNLVTCAIENNTSAILAIPVRDTLKFVQDGQNIEHTVSRAHLWQAQTPQISQLAWLKSAIEMALAQQLDITDEASALEAAGYPVRIVAGQASNLKITYPEDLVLAQCILAMQ